MKIEVELGVDENTLKTIKEIFDVLSSTQSSAIEKDFYEELYEIDHPLSSFEHLTIKETDEYNPYNVIINHPSFQKL